MKQPGPIDPDEDEATGLPFLRTWPRVYGFAIGCLALWIVLLAALPRLFP